ncbi:phosphoglycolate phosphatase [Amylibacter cionae]|uniref:phosphoglycolate phosphatase n=2 Tax=Neptunicoccus cionae TaxID=2035344 RepID=A0A916VRG8_9RHOB|nr:phosphoglycolate phosphatase [Amylibacter cionae]
MRYKLWHVGGKGNEMKSVIFDLDGTLADTSGDLIAAANACFDGLGHGLLLDAEADMLTAFHGGRAMLRLGFSRIGEPWDEAMVDAQYDVLLRHYGENIAVHTKLYPNVEQSLEELKSRGYLLGVCTNKPAALAETLMGQLGVRPMFGALLGADTLPVRKPDPEHLWETIRRVGGDLERSVLIGDTDNDRSAARNANVPSVLVTFGPSGQGVSEMEPEALLHHYDDLPDLADQLVR